MGRITTPTYRVELFGRKPDGGMWREHSAWRGRVSVKRLAEYVAARVDSEKPGEANDQLPAHRGGWLINPSRAVIVRQRGNETVCEWNAPAFLIF